MTKEGRCSAVSSWWGFQQKTHFKSKTYKILNPLILLWSCSLVSLYGLHKLVRIWKKSTLILLCLKWLCHTANQPAKLYLQSKRRALNWLVQRSSRNRAFINYSFAHIPDYNMDFVKIWDLQSDVFLSKQQYEEMFELIPLVSSDNHISKVHHCLKWLQFLRMKIRSLSCLDQKGGTHCPTKHPVRKAVQVGKFGDQDNK